MFEEGVKMLANASDLRIFTSIIAHANVFVKEGERVF